MKEVYQVFKCSVEDLEDELNTLYRTDHKVLDSLTYTGVPGEVVVVVKAR